MAVHSYSYHAQGSIVKFLGNPIFNQMVVQVFFGPRKMMSVPLGWHFPGKLPPQCWVYVAMIVSLWYTNLEKLTNGDEFQGLLCHWPLLLWWTYSTWIDREKLWGYLWQSSWRNTGLGGESQERIWGMVNLNVGWCKPVSIKQHYCCIWARVCSFLSIFLSCITDLYYTSALVQSLDYCPVDKSLTTTQLVPTSQKFHWFNSGACSCTVLHSHCPRNLSHLYQPITCHQLLSKKWGLVHRNWDHIITQMV